MKIERAKVIAILDTRIRQVEERIELGQKQAEERDALALAEWWERGPKAIEELSKKLDRWLALYGEQGREVEPPTFHSLDWPKVSGSIYFTPARNSSQVKYEHQLDRRYIENLTNIRDLIEGSPDEFITSAGLRELGIQDLFRNF